MSRSEAFILRLELQFESWNAICGDLDSPALDRRPGAEKWSAREHLAHIGRMHEVYDERLYRILTENSPALPQYRAQDDVAWPAWHDLSGPEIFERTFRLREKLMERLQALPESSFDRTGVHGKFGPLALSVWIDFFLIHEAHHLYRIFTLAREHGA